MHINSWRNRIFYKKYKFKIKIENYPKNLGERRKRN